MKVTFVNKVESWTWTGTLESQVVSHDLNVEKLHKLSILLDAKEL